MACSLRLHGFEIRWVWGWVWWRQIWRAVSRFFLTVLFQFYDKLLDLHLTRTWLIQLLHFHSSPDILMPFDSIQWQVKLYTATHMGVSGLLFIYLFSSMCSLVIPLPTANQCGKVRPMIQCVDYLFRVWVTISSWVTSATMWSGVVLRLGPQTASPTLFTRHPEHVHPHSGAMRFNCLDMAAMQLGDRDTHTFWNFPRGEKGKTFNISYIETCHRIRFELPWKQTLNKII